MERKDNKIRDQQQGDGIVKHLREITNILDVLQETENTQTENP